MKNEVKDIHVQKLTTKTEWDDDKRALSTTIQVKTNLSIEKLSDLLAIQRLDAPIYITVGSDQAKLALEVSPEAQEESVSLPS